MDATVTAVVPVKALGKAKQRLATALSPRERRELVVWMLGRVAAACKATPAVGSLLVVAGDVEAGRLAAACGAEVMVEDSPGLNRALAAADAVLGDAVATLVVAADLPLAGPADLEAVCAAGASGPAVVVAPTDDGGTGALLRRPPGVIPPAYGSGSAERHLALARAVGARAVRLDRPGLAVDVDDELALRRLRQRIPGLTAPEVLGAKPHADQAEPPGREGHTVAWTPTTGAARCLRGR